MAAPDGATGASADRPTARNVSRIPADSRPQVYDKQMFFPHSPKRRKASADGFRGRRAAPRAAVCAAALLAAVATIAPAHALPPADTIEYGFSIYDRMVQYGPTARRRLAPYFRAAGVAYPPHTVLLVGLKWEKRVELYAGDSPHSLKFIRYYDVLGASGGIGPKLREGDRQVPEGIYRFTQLNPNSRYHLSVKVDYPNAFDRMMGRIDDRGNLGGGIFIHGGSESAGCLAMSDSVAEEIFTLVAHTGIDNASIILSPVDMRREPPPDPVSHDVPVWAPHLYSIIQRALLALPPVREDTRWQDHWASFDHPIE